MVMDFLMVQEVKSGYDPLGTGRLIDKLPTEE